MFFYRTEKIGKINDLIFICENGKKKIILRKKFFIKFSKPTPENWTFLNVVVVDTGTWPTKNIINFTLKMVRIINIIFLFTQTKNILNVILY